MQRQVAPDKGVMIQKKTCLEMVEPVLSQVRVAMDMALHERNTSRMFQRVLGKTFVQLRAASRGEERV
ncbi:hypothetical protein FJZ48_01230 [Candidatus Uhrbacteria bacterium]|nr:hypothetical protein [Candidatus Uhrbacteria bacterium]